MRNLKKFLALVLAMMMVFSLMITVNAADFADADEVSPAYAEAVEVLAGIGVIEGDSHDELTPQSGFTRAHLATVAYRVGTGSVADNTEVELFRAPGQFDDVRENHWANPYINFAYNAEWVHGVNDAQTLYNPGGDVTGYHALTILLQILGYGKQDEFLGRDWQIQAARYGKEAGLTDGLINTTLTKAATREEVFQMMFNALQAHPVTYSADAKGYTESEETWGEKYFDLACVNTVDDWGRPVKQWYNTVTGKTYATITSKPVAEFHVAMSDCDIIDEFGLEEDSIVDFYLNGNKTATALVSPEGDSKLEELDVTDYIGSQGCITEIYAVAAGYHIVQINTYLAKVTKVTAPYTDPKGHTTDRTIDLEIYPDTTGTRDNFQFTKTVASDVYAKGDHVLVQINKPVDVDSDGAFYSHASDTFGKVVLVGTAPVIGSGTLTTWTSVNGDTPATSTVGGKKLNENVSFARNWHVTGTSWIAYGDQFDDVNLIGLDVGTENYVLIEALAWIHPGTVKGGYAAADLITTDGETLENVRVAAIGYTAATTDPAKNYNDGLADGDGEVADNWLQNINYYGHLYTYAVNEDNEYILTRHTDPATNIVDVNTTGKITQKSPRITDGTDNLKAVATDFTVFMVYNATTGAYDKYVGKDKVPSLINADICVLNNEDGYAVLVIAKGDPVNSSSGMVAYVGDISTVSGRSGGYDGYCVYPIGSIEPVIIYDKDGTWAANVTETGLYSFSVDAKNIFTGAPTPLAADSDPSGTSVGTGNVTTVSNTNYHTMVAGAVTTGTSIHADEWDNPSKTITTVTYSVYKLAFNTNNPDLKVIEVSKLNDTPNAAAVALREIAVTDINKDDVIIVVYNNSNTASYIYVIKEAITGGGVGVVPGNKTKTEIVSISFDSGNLEVIFDSTGLTNFTTGLSPVKATIRDSAGVIVNGATATYAADVGTNYKVTIPYPGTITANTVTSGTITIDDYTITWSNMRLL